jgi:hypothetical protein
MAPRTCFSALAVTIVMVCCANWAVGRASSNSMPRQIMRHVQEPGSAIDLLGMGNSLVATGFDESELQATFQKAGQAIVAINGGLGATGTIEHLAMTRLALQHRTVREIIYGFFDQQLSAEQPLKNSDIIGNRAMLYYDEPQLTLRYAHFDWLELLEFQTYRCCALLRERGTIWTKVEKMRRSMQEVGMPRQETNQFGRRNDFSLLEFSDPRQFARSCQEVMSSGDFLSPPIQELFKEAQSYGARVTVVLMPMHPLHLERFYDQPVWEQFARLNRTAVERAGATYIDASRWIPEEADFQDHLHLSESGGKRFSRLLAEQILARGDFPIYARH